MGKSDPQTSPGKSGRTANESTSPNGEAEGGETPLSEDEKWGFTDKKGGLPSETKAGIAIVVILLCAFGFIAYNKYGKGLEDNQVASTGDESQPEGPDESDPPAAPPATEVPSAFDQPKDTTRVAAYEQDFLGGQGEPAATSAATPAASEWAPEQEQDDFSAQAAAATLTAQADDFEGFGDLAAQNPAPAANEHQHGHQHTPAADPFDAGDPFAGVAAATATAPPQPEQPAAVASPLDEDPWGDAGVAASQPAVSSEPEAFNPAFDADPIEAAPAQPSPGRVAMESAPVDSFDAAFDDLPARQPVAQANPDSGFGADAFEAQPVAQPREPAAIAQPASAAPVTQVVSQPVQDQAQAADAFDLGSDDIDFGDTPVRRETFDPEPAQPQRYDRGNAERAVSRTTESFESPEPRERVGTTNRLYTVRSADTYWAISKKVYSTSRYYRALAKFNKNAIPDPRRMRPGTELAIPEPAVLERHYPELIPNARATAIPARIDTRRTPGLYIDSENRPVYLVGSSDSLSRIAQRHLGRASRWTQIYDLNRGQLSRPEDIRPGMLLAMPTDASQVAQNYR